VGQDRTALINFRPGEQIKKIVESIPDNMELPPCTKIFSREQYGRNLVLVEKSTFLHRARRRSALSPFWKKMLCQIIKAPLQWGVTVALFARSIGRVMLLLNAG